MSMSTLNRLIFDFIYFIFRYLWFPHVIQPLNFLIVNFTLFSFFMDVKRKSLNVISISSTTRHAHENTMNNTNSCNARAMQAKVHKTDANNGDSARRPKSREISSCEYMDLFDNNFVARKRPPTQRHVGHDNRERD